MGEYIEMHRKQKTREKLILIYKAVFKTGLQTPIREQID